MGVSYALAGLSHPALLGAITGIFAMIPFAAKLIFRACSLVLVAEGHVAAGGGLFAYGMILTLVADNYVRPTINRRCSQAAFYLDAVGNFRWHGNFRLMGFIFRAYTPGNTDVDLAGLGYRSG
jgi:hypothetical protein